VIAAIFTENDTLLLDATEKNCPYYLLPMRALNGQAQFIDKNRTGWVQLATDKKAKQMVTYNLAIEEDLSLKGNIIYLRGDYAALDFRNDYEDFNSNDEYLTDYKEGKKGIKIISHKINNIDSIYKPINEEFELVIKNAVSDIDGELYIIPVLFEQVKENPFKVIDRKYPIDFGYAREKTIVVNYTFPQGYMVVNMPVNANLKLPENSAIFSCKSTVSEGKISIVYKLNINSSLILQTEYLNLREFYNQIIAKEAEPIVLKKK
jgi:transposase